MVHIYNKLKYGRLFGMLVGYFRRRLRFPLGEDVLSVSWSIDSVILFTVKH